MRLKNKITEFKFINPEIVQKRYEVSKEDIYNLIINKWTEFDRPRFYNGSIHTNYKPEKLYFEVCNTRYERGVYVPKDDMKKVLREQLIQPKKDQHMSTYLHCQRWVNNVKDTGKLSGATSKVTTPYVYVELDRDSLDDAIADASLMAMRFPYPEHMRFWFSGNKSIHIGVDARLFGEPMGWAKDVAGRGQLFYNLAERIAGDVRHGNGCTDPFFMKREEVADVYYETFGEPMSDDEQGLMDARKDLEGFDPALFSTNSLIRTPFSIHEKSGKRKWEVSLDGLMRMELEPTKRKVKNYVPPLLIDWTFDCYPKKERPVKPTTFTTDSGMVTAVYSKYVDSFDQRDVNSDGFVTGLLNPLYEDTRGSCSVNLETGEMHDFGSGVTYDLPEFLGKLKGIGRKKAKTIIETENYEQL